MVEIISKYDRSIVDKCCSTSGYKKHVDDLDADVEIIHSLQIDITKNERALPNLELVSMTCRLNPRAVDPTEMLPPYLRR
jgi:hypothetical protein